MTIRCSFCLILLLCLAWGHSNALAGEQSLTTLAEAGKPGAQIVIASNPPRMVTLAAQELQSHIQKISGATLPILTDDSGQLPVTIYVGRSVATDKMGVSGSDLKHGAYRVIINHDSVVLLGHDADSKPITQLPDGSAQAVSKDEPLTREALASRWYERTQSDWPDRIGGQSRTYNAALGINAWDQRGSLNAVYHLLRKLGVEWYMPGEIGEVIPRNVTIRLKQGKFEEHPHFALRAVYPISRNWQFMQQDDVLWSLRLGLNTQSETVGHVLLQSHGMNAVLGSPTLRKNHPEYYALFDGQRNTDGGKIKPCLSSKGLMEEQVRYLRAAFDTYDVPMLSVMPPDGFGKACECDLCKDKLTPERGHNGNFSDYVWQFVNQVAIEINKTHPDKLINCFAYSTYLLPPEHIKKLSPNIVVGIVHGRSGEHNQASSRAIAEEIRQQWLNLSSHPLISWEHYPFTNRGFVWPAYQMHIIERALASMHGRSLGEFIEVPWGPMKERGQGLHQVGFNHLNVFVTARLFWKDHPDLDTMLNQYYEQFYGPAGASMKEFITYCESNWEQLAGRIDNIDKVLALFQQAQDKATPDSIYGKRIAMLGEYIQLMKKQREQLAEGRDANAQAIARLKPKPGIKLDGLFDEAAWQDLPVYELKNIYDGSRPGAPTTFRLFWDDADPAYPSGGSLYLAIHCQDPDMRNLAVTAQRDGDSNIWNGDCVELLIQTQVHTYYQIVIGPNGVVVDLDRNGVSKNEAWQSGVQVAVHKNKSGWDIELRLPAPGGDVAGDPLHDVVGPPPTQDHSWYFNLCRQRVRATGKPGLSAFSPTGSGSFHNVIKFGSLSIEPSEDIKGTNP